MVDQIFMIAEAATTWSTKTLRMVTVLTAKTKYMVVFEAGKQVRWMIQWFGKVEIFEDLLFEIKCDNNAAIALTLNMSRHSCVKHIDVKHHWIHEAVEVGNLIITYIPTKDNITDLFTKALSHVQFEKLVKLMGLGLI